MQTEADVLEGLHLAPATPEQAEQAGLALRDAVGFSQAFDHDLRHAILAESSMLPIVFSPTVRAEKRKMLAETGTWPFVAEIHRSKTNKHSLPA
ncbi:hypothetical protein P3T42_006281 [Paraburkholderia sp. GAS38]|uniref:hypothetical protein n=1 Tax=Paraburkholderia sp. GAS38 TaxID=3035133 RepID=UPI003D1E2DD0